MRGIKPSRDLLTFLLFAILSLLYIGDVAPGLGSGPSAILSDALSAGGLAPVPGYPVHGALARLTLWLPGEPAYLLNLLSFFIMVGAITLTARVLASSTDGTPAQEWLAGLFLGWVAFRSPGLSRLAFFSERYSTEIFFLAVSAVFYIAAVRSPERHKRSLVLLSFFATFHFFCHVKSWPLVGLLTVHLAYLHVRAGQRLPYAAMAGAALLGTAPILYLVAISRLDPLFDWNNPETLSQLYSSFTRKEYGGLPIWRSVDEWLEDWRRQYSLLFAQFHPAVLVAAATATIGVLWRAPRRAWPLVFVVLWLGEGVSVLQHYTRPADTGVFAQLMNWHMLNYFGAYYFLIAALAALALVRFIQRVPRAYSARVAAVGICALIVASSLSPNPQARADSRLAAEMADNFERLLPVDSVLFTNIDTLFAALDYHQREHGRLQGRAFLHTELMFRSWYLNDVRRRYPWLWHQEPSLARLLAFIESFEASGYDQRRFSVSSYYAALNEIAAARAETGAFVATDPAITPLRPGLFMGMQWEPAGLAYQLRRGSYLIGELPQFTFTALKRESRRGDYWALRFQALYQSSIRTRLARARLLGNTEVVRLQEVDAELN